MARHPFRTVSGFLVVLVLALPARAGMDEANQAYDRGDMKTAFGEYLAEAELGNAIAQYQIGLLYRDGLGTKQNYVAAGEWFRKAAEQGDADAQYELSELLYWGDGVEADLKESAHWTRLAAEQGHLDAQYALGTMYYTGDGVPVDLEQSAHWTLLAAEQGHAESQYTMGLNYYFGEGVPEDMAEYFRWTELAANQGHLGAQFDLGDTYFYGEEGVAADRDEARHWYEMAAAQGDADAQAMLDQMSGKTVPADGPVDPSLVGLWEMYVFLEQAWKVWELDIAADGTYSFYDDGVFGHSGTFEAQNGTWELVSQTNAWTDGGSYEMPNNETFNMIGSLGPGSWHRTWP